MCPSVDEWVKIWQIHTHTHTHTHTGVLLSILPLSFATMWLELV